jgi:hypothetical protein
MDDRIATDKHGLSATSVLVPTSGLAPRPTRWTIFLSWEASFFSKDIWRNSYVPMWVRFDQSLIDATLQFVSRLHAADPRADNSQRVPPFVARFPARPPNRDGGTTDQIEGFPMPAPGLP